MRCLKVSATISIRPEVLQNCTIFLKRINSIKAGILKVEQMDEEVFNKLLHVYVSFNEEVLGISEEKMNESTSILLLVDNLMQTYREARAEKNFVLVDKIRAQFKDAGLVIMDGKMGSEWGYQEG